MTLDQAVQQATTRIARRDAERLLEHLLHRDRAWLMTHSDQALLPAMDDRLQALVARRAAREPLQYLLGEQEFYGLALRVTRDTLIPRPETEHLVEAVLHWCGQQPMPLRIVDVGTGTGAIALALAQHLPAAEIAACDVSPAALAVAVENAERLGLSGRVAFRLSDLLAGFGDDRFDAVVSNPPYIPAGDAAEMQPEVRDHEPHLALFAGADGLAIYRRLVAEAGVRLRAGGLLAMEIGYAQSEALRGLLDGWQEVRFVDDYAGIPRVVMATRSGME